MIKFKKEEFYGNIEYKSTTRNYSGTSQTTNSK